MARRRRPGLIDRLSQPESTGPTFLPTRSGYTKQQQKAADLPRLIQPHPGCHLYRLPVSKVYTAEELEAKDAEKVKDVETFRRLENALEQNWLAQHLTQDARAQVVHHMARRFFKADALIVVQGEPSEALFVVAEGQCELLRQESGRFNPSDKAGISMVLEPGDIFGESAMIHACSNAETVMSSTDAVLWSISRVDYQRLLHSHANRAFDTRFDLLRSLRWLDVLSDGQVQWLACSSRLHCCTVGTRLAFQRNPPEPRCRYIVEKRKKGEGGGLGETMWNATGTFGETGPVMLADLEEGTATVGKVQELQSAALEPPAGHDTLLLLERVVAISDSLATGATSVLPGAPATPRTQAVEDLVGNAVAGAVAAASGARETQRLELQMLVIGGRCLCKAIGPKAVVAVQRIIAGQRGHRPPSEEDTRKVETPIGTMSPTPVELSTTSAVNTYGLRFDQHDPTG